MKSLQNHTNIRYNKFEVICSVCNKERLVTYSMYRLIYPVRKQQTRDGKCVQCANNKPNKTSFCIDQIPWNKGLGTKTSEIQRARHSKEYRIWRTSVFERDNYTCGGCHKRGGILHADHIKSFTFTPEKRYDIDNGRTLCKKCHEKTDNYGWRGVHNRSREQLTNKNL